MEAIQLDSHFGPKAGLIDVIFIHGFSGDGMKTWTNSSGQFWPRWLLDEFEGLAVFSVRYASSIFWRKPNHSLRELAIALIEKITSSPLRRNNTPIVFVCHSLGGLVIKEILSVARDNDRWKNLINNTKLVVFIATPHSRLSLLRSFAAVPGFSKLLLLLTKTERLDRLGDVYRGLALSKKIETVVFYERYPTKLKCHFKLTIVNNRDADPKASTANSIVTPIPIDADHIDICKPKERDYLLFQTIRNRIAGLRLSRNLTLWSTKPATLTQAPTAVSSDEGVGGASEQASRSRINRSWIVLGVLCVVGGIFFSLASMRRVSNESDVVPARDGSIYSEGGLNDSSPPIAPGFVEVDDGVARNDPQRNLEQKGSQEGVEVVAWARALSLDTLIAYRSYIDEFPDSKQAADAKSTIEEIDELKWLRALRQGSIAAYVEYLIEVPTGRWAESAARSIARLVKADGGGLRRPDRSELRTQESKRVKRAGSARKRPRARDNDDFEVP
ncbi:hypothetical protein [Rhodopseudomonas sp. WA056]|uniref:esterase/lipase family protein n=1 Tax=Rhodopseudomonas sp. WA056 TaxID=2269367 RepID=UPI0013DF259E